MIDALSLWLLLGLAGLLGLPLAAFVFGRLPGGGLAFARPLGLLVAAYPPWLLASLHVLPYSRWSAVLGLALLGAIVLVFIWIRRPAIPRPRGLLGRLDVRLWLASEAVFTAGFAACALVRSYSPDVWQTEKPMDMAFVNAVNRSESFPPHDPWLAGEDLNYYYFGHYLVAFFGRLAALEPSVSFNLGVALFYALTATAVFALTSAVLLALRPGAGTRRPVLAGLAALAFALVLGNLAGGVQLLRDGGPLGQYDWWAPSRVIDGTANEFPSFSFLLGDLHAHVMATPFTLTAVALALQLALSGPRVSATGAAELVLGALVVGALYAINSLDYATALALVLLGLLLWMTRRDAQGRFACVLWGFAFAAATLILFAPFVIRFSPESKGIALVGGLPSFTRFVRDETLIYGLLFWVLAAAFVWRVRELGLPRRYLAWASVAGMVLLVLLAPRHVAGLALVLAVLGLATYTALDPANDQPDRFLWLLVATGFALLAIPEVVYIRDIFDGSPSYRFNTVFKLGYQAWFFFAVAAGCVVMWGRRWLGRWLRMGWLAGLVLLVVLAAAYPVAGTYARSGGFSRPPTLDGLRWLQTTAPGDLAAIRWLRANSDGNPVLLEAVGRDFDAAGHARVSTFTGLPTVLGWAEHERQWGHDPGSREADVRTIYSTRDPARARSLLTRHRVRYVIVGFLERGDYPAAGLEKFGRLATPVFSSQGTTVYRVTR